MMTETVLSLWGEHSAGSPACLELLLLDFSENRVLPVPTFTQPLPLSSFGCREGRCLAMVGSRGPGTRGT